MSGSLHILLRTERTQETNLTRLSSICFSLVTIDSAALKSLQLAALNVLVAIFLHNDYLRYNRPRFILLTLPLLPLASLVPHCATCSDQMITQLVDSMRASALNSTSKKCVRSYDLEFAADALGLSLGEDEPAPSAAEPQSDVKGMPFV